METLIHFNRLDVLENVIIKSGLSGKLNITKSLIEKWKREEIIPRGDFYGICLAILCFTKEHKSTITEELVLELLGCVKTQDHALSVKCLNKIADVLCK